MYLLLPLLAQAAAPLVSVDSGLDRRAGAARTYVDASVCTAAVPCVLGVHGAVRLTRADETAKTEVRPPLEVELWRLAGSRQERIDLFQYAPGAPSALWQAARRSRNDAVVNVADLVNGSDHEPVLYVYGLNLRYPLNHGELLYLEVSEPGDLPDRYYFRYWAQGLQYAFNLSTLFPVSGLAAPAVQGALDASNVNAAVSVELFAHLRPDQEHPLPLHLLSGVHPTLLIGGLSGFRLNEGNVVKTTDFFLGGGLSAFRFLSAGVAFTLLDPFGAHFPYAAIHVDEAVRLMLLLSNNPSRRWRRYIQQEDAAAEPEAGTP